MPEKVRLSVDVMHHLRTISDGQPRRVEDLAVLLGTSKNFLHQVVAKLRQGGMLVVIKGPRGGVATSINDHNLLKVYQLFGYMTEEVEGSLPSSEIERHLRKVLADIVL